MLLVSGLVLPKKDVAKTAPQGDFVMHNSPVEFRQLVIQLFTTLFLIQALKVHVSLSVCTLYESSKRYISLSQFVNSINGLNKIFAPSGF